MLSTSARRGTAACSWPSAVSPGRAPEKSSSRRITWLMRPTCSAMMPPERASSTGDRAPVSIRRARASTTPSGVPSSWAIAGSRVPTMASRSASRRSARGVSTVSGSSCRVHARRQRPANRGLGRGFSGPGAPSGPEWARGEFADGAHFRLSSGPGTNLPEAARGTFGKYALVRSVQLETRRVGGRASRARLESSRSEGEGGRRGSGGAALGASDAVFGSPSS